MSINKEKRMAGDFCLLSDLMIRFSICRSLFDG